MPNWCHNYMEITGPADEITRFKQFCLGAVFKGEPEQIDFNKIVPMPEDLKNQELSHPRPERNWYDWACDHWGTKWNACHYHVGRDEPGLYECGFDTAWSPPVPIWEKIGEMFSKLTFVLGGSEPLADYGYEGSIKGGKVDVVKVPLVWEWTNSVTGETIKGTQDEIPDAMGPSGGTVVNYPDDKRS